MLTMYFFCNIIPFRKEDGLLNKKQTSKQIASVASKVLRDKRTSKASKSAAASALAQTRKK